MDTKIENYINHIAFVLDASSSMSSHKRDLIKVADNQISYLAQRSKELDQETRVTIYSFNYHKNIQCLVYDKDVLRMPTIQNLYRVEGQTALIDATLFAIGDLKQTPQKYGEHAFLIYVLTDGQENDSLHKSSDLSREIGNLPDNWTLATFVPDQSGVFEAKKFGFLKDNISVWDASSSKGILEAGRRIKETTDTFMQGRKLGMKGTKNLFSLTLPSLSKIQQTLDGLNAWQYRLLPIFTTSRIDKFIESNLQRPYKLGEGYYELTKSETVQPQKNIAILTKDKVYIGQKARDLLGLPNYHVKVRPVDFPEYKIFIQSTSLNRKLIPNTHLLVLS